MAKTEANIEVQFHPTKRLFIETLTKDINIQDCILDLFDNAVDSYVRRNIKDRRVIKAEFGKNEFVVFDNCGGISRKQLTEHVFRFGMVALQPDLPTIGMYGIGLKRAIFKLGKDIIFETDDGKEYSRLEFNVDQWIRKGEEKWEDWNIPLTRYTSSKIKLNEKPYTRISIKNLNNETKEAFTEAFKQKFRKTIQIYYTIFIQNHIDIFIDKQKQQYLPIEIKTPKGYSPERRTDKFNDINVDVICWISYKEEDKRMIKERGRQGWNIFMNRRLILSDNVGPETGWSGNPSELPKYHSLFNEFRGLVFLSSDDPSKLPLNTHKNGFNQETATYVFLLRRMVDAARPIVKYLEKKYNKQKQSIEEKEDELNDLVEKLEKDWKPKSLDINKVSKESKFTYPPLKIRAELKTTSIQYIKPREQVNKLKKELGVQSNSEVGSKSFDYCYKAYTVEPDNE